MTQRALASLAFTWLVACLLGGGSARAQTFPSDAQWIVLTRDGNPIADPQNDAQGERDIVGDADDPPAYVFGDAAYVYFRLRVDSDPLSANGDYRPFGWGVEIDTDGDLTAYELLSLVDGIAMPDRVVLRQNAMSDTGMSARDVAETLLATYDAATHARALSAPSMFGGDEDFFVDWALDRQALTDAGVDLSRPWRLAFGTSNNAQTLASDLMATTTLEAFADIVTDPVLCSGTSCTPCTDLCGASCLRCEGATPACDGMACVECATSADCPEGEPLCDRASGTCVAAPPCVGDDDCTAQNPACQPDGSCGQCSASNTSACDATTPLCDVDAGRCRGCEDDGDCLDPASPACQPDGRCGECSLTNAARCMGDTPRCETARGTCEPACSTDADCDDPELPACTERGTCAECSATHARRCDADLEACNVALGACTETCDSDAQCTGVRPICTNAGLCVECKAAALDACSGDEPICDVETGACVAKACADDRDCGNPALPACQPDGRCSQCSATETSRCIGDLPECDVSVGACVAEGEGAVDGGAADAGLPAADGGRADAGADAGAPTTGSAHYEGGGIGCAASRARRPPALAALPVLLLLALRRSRNRSATRRSATPRWTTGA